jgi:transcriptional regulator with XRE-family HTH domain
MLAPLKPRRHAGTMPAAPITGPTVRARLLACNLVALREHERLTRAAAAKALGWSVPKLARFESAYATPGVPSVAALCRLYNAPDNVAVALVQLTKEARTRGWWADYHDILQGPFTADEDAACRIRSWQPEVIPGLLQTSGYAAALAEADHPDDKLNERRIETKMARRALLTGRNAPQLDAVIGEAVLLIPVGSPAVMAEQLAYLLQPRPNVTVQVMPFAAGPHAGMGGRFVQLDFPAELEHMTACFIETPGGDLYPESEWAVERIRVAFKQVTELAVSPEQSACMIREACDRYQREATQ